MTQQSGLIKSFPLTSFTDDSWRPNKHMACRLTISGSGSSYALAVVFERRIRPDPPSCVICFHTPVEVQYVSLAARLPSHLEDGMALVDLPPAVGLALAAQACFLPEADQSKQYWLADLLVFGQRLRAGIYEDLGQFLEEPDAA